MLQTEIEPPTSLRLRWLVGAVSAAYLGLLLALVPFAGIQGPALPQLVGVFVVGIAVTEVSTAFLLFAEAREIASRAVLLLGCAYLFSALMALLHLLTFPGALVPGATVLGGAKTTSYIFNAWRIGFPLIVVIALLAEAARRSGRRSAERPPEILPAAAIVVGIVAALGLAAVLAQDALPDTTPGGRWSSWGATASWVSIALTACAVILTWTVTRGRELLFLWLGLALIAFAGDLVAIVGGGRFTLGFYAGRASVFVSAFVLFALFLARFAQRNRRLGAALVEVEDRSRSLAAEVARREAAEGRMLRMQKIEAIGQLTGGIAHDFNNLFQVIIGSLDVVRHGLKEGAPQPETLLPPTESAFRGAARAAALTQQLLAFARQQPLAPEPIDLNALIDRMSALLSRMLGDRIAVEIAASDALWPTLADAGQLESAVLNLVLNARDAMKEGGRLTFTTRNARLDARQAAEGEDVEPGDYVMLAIGDTGHGMTAEVVRRAFDPFFTTKEIGGGSGLGLSQVYGFAKQSGGHAKIESAPGRGTTIALYLPRFGPATTGPR